MDLSKLPKLSETPKPPEPQVPQVIESVPAAVVSVGGEAWICLAVGIILLLMQQRLFMLITGRGAELHFVDGNNLPIPYTASLFFINDVGLAAFGIALILDGIVLFIGRPLVVWIGLIAMAIASLLNVFTVVRAYPLMGLQWYPALAFVLGIYTVIYQWKLLELIQKGNAAPMT